MRDRALPLGRRPQPVQRGRGSFKSQVNKLQFQHSSHSTQVTTLQIQRSRSKSSRRHAGEFSSRCQLEMIFVIGAPDAKIHFITFRGAMCYVSCLMFRVGICLQQRCGAIRVSVRCRQQTRLTPSGPRLGSNVHRTETDESSWTFSHARSRLLVATVTCLGRHLQYFEEAMPSLACSLLFCRASIGAALLDYPFGADSRPG